MAKNNHPELIPRCGACTDDIFQDGSVIACKIFRVSANARTDNILLAVFGNETLLTANTRGPSISRLLVMMAPLPWLMDIDFVDIWSVRYAQSHLKSL